MPGKQWDDEDETSSSAESASPKIGATRRGNKFDDEEGEDSDVIESWDADDSEAEREKAKKAADAKAKADAAAAANKKSKGQRIAEHQADRARRAAEGDESSDEETEAQKRERLRRTEKEADLAHASDLFGDIGVSNRRTTTAGSAVVVDSKDPTNTVDLSALPLFNPVTKLQFEKLRETLVPIIGGQSKKAHYVLFLQEFAKQLAKDLPSDQIKKISSTLTALSNEKMKEEKQADKGGKKSKAQKTKTTLAISRPNVADTNTYEETYGDDDFM